MSLLKPATLLNHLHYTCRRFLIGSRSTLCTVASSTSSQKIPDPKKNDEDNQHSIPPVAEEHNESHDVTKEQLLQTALAFVPQHGWGTQSLIEGADVLGVSGDIPGLFPSGGIELVNFFNEKANSELTKCLIRKNEQLERDGVGRKKVGLFIRDALEIRMRMLEPYISKWPQAIALMMLPQNALDSAKHMGTLVDNIWYHAGDRSVDFNWYTKRATLAAVYQTSVLFMLQDKSEDFSNTWSFMERRLNGVNFVGQSFQQVQTAAQGLSTGLFTAFQLAKNMMKMGDMRR